MIKHRSLREKKNSCLLLPVLLYRRVPDPLCLRVTRRVVVTKSVLKKDIKTSVGQCEGRRSALIFSCCCWSCHPSAYFPFWSEAAWPWGRSRPHHQPPLTTIRTNPVTRADTVASFPPGCPRWRAWIHSTENYSVLYTVSTQVILKIIFLTLLLQQNIYLTKWGKYNKHDMDIWAKPIFDH